MRRREQRHWRRLARVAASAEHRAHHDWTTHTAPIAEKLDRGITRAQHRVADLQSQAAFRDHWLADHPDLADASSTSNESSNDSTTRSTPRLLDRLDAISARVAPTPARTLECHDISKIRERLDRLERARAVEPPGLSL
ncbi:MAG TPA: hypothetical protein VE623_20320 [Acidimicrobiales bacterium]|nr:hypothetical protein [Acidimicrobiales bacterium]